MRSRIYMLCRLKPLSSTVLLKLYKAYVLPLSDYCCISYQSCSKPLSERLDHVHHKAMRLLTSHTPVLNSILPSFPSVRRKYFIAIQTFKILKGMAPSYLLSTVHYSETLSHRALRNKHRVHVPVIKTNYGRNSFYFQCTKLWNSLPYKLFTCHSLNYFKLLYKSIFKIK